MDRAIKVAGLELAHPIMNAAGTCKKIREVVRFSESGVSAIVVGSYTVEPRKTPANAYYFDPVEDFSLNSMKLPNGGIEYLKRHLAAMRDQRPSPWKKPLVLNIAGKDADDFALLARLAVEHDVAAIEVNLSCPTGPAPIYFQREPTALVVNAVNRVAYGKVPVWYKLGPIADPIQLRSQVKLIADKGADGIVATNTYGGAMLFQNADRRPVMRHRPMGLGGKALLTIGVGMVAQLRDILPDHIDVIGVGGISDGFDVMQYLAAGAAAVQVGTACWARDRDPSVYYDIRSDYQSCLELP